MAIYDQIAQSGNRLAPATSFAQGQQAGQQMQSNQLAMQGQRMKQAQAMRQEVARAAQWADTPEKWDQAVDFLSKTMSPDIAKYKGQFNMRGAVLESLKQASGGTPYYTAVPTSTGYVTFDARTGKAVPTMVEGSGAMPPTSVNGVKTSYPWVKQVVPISADPSLKGRMQYSSSKASEQGKATGKAIADLPKTLATAEQVVATIDQLAENPALESISGLNVGQVTKNIPGTDAAEAQAMIDQLGGQVFLDAFTTLKGGGQITEIEGAKATAARTRALNPKLGYKARLSALKEYRDAVMKGIERAKKEAGIVDTTPAKEQQFPQAAVDYLMQNDSPELRQQFEAKYGALPEGM